MNRRPVVRTREIAEFERRTEDEPDALTYDELLVVDRLSRDLWPRER